MNLTTILAIYVTLITTYAYATLPDTSPVVAEVVTDEKLKAALSYHGILGADLVNGRWTFERDGKVCRLYGDTFETWWEDNK